MLQTEEEKNIATPSSKCPLFNDPNNDIAGPSTAAPIRGLIFDVGSTLFTATEEKIKNEMENAIKQTLATHFNWTSDDIQLFWSYYDNIHKQYDSKKLFIGTGSIHDEGHWPEPSIKSWIIDACKKMNKLQINENDSIFDDAIKAFRTPRVNNAKLIPKVIETITELRHKYGIRSAICSNDRCASRLKHIFKRHKLLNNDGTSNHFDIIMISAEIGRRKPDVRLVLPILNKWKNDCNISREEIVFVGDKLHTDIQAARHLGLRAIHCNLYNRNDSKYKAQKKRKPNTFHIRKGTYIGGHTNDFLIKFNEFHNLYDTPDVVLNDYSDFVGILRKLAANNGVIKVSNFNVFKWRPLIIGVLLRPEKIEKFRKKRLFEIMDYRKDIIYKPIDVTMNISKQGPFDIILHKLNWYYFNGKFDNKIAGYLDNALKYIKSIKTNLNIEIDEKTDGNEVINEHLTYITDDPELGVKCQDRWYVYNTINNANITVNYDEKEGVNISCPKTILITFDEIKKLQLKQINGKLKNDMNNKILNEIKSMKFPLYFKPRTSGRTPTNRYDGHCLYIVACIENIYEDKELFNNLLENEMGDWILQEYIDHLSGCHKVYNLGYFVFASINHSTPSIQNIMKENKNKFMRINSTGISSKFYDDQSVRDQLSSTANEFYQKISCQLKDAFKINLFGFDMIFDTKSNYAYVVDLNFMPSFKIVENFHTILNEYLLYEYHHFVKKYKNK
eukprot:369767_1